jgi:tRNA A-37 threonylcarbamoyl transferase component Bud32
MATCPHCGTANPGDASFCGGCGKRIGETGAAAGMQTISALETIASLPTNRGRGDEVVELAPGAEFAGRYVIDQVIGKGGMGVVYRAHDKLVDKAIALKLIRRDRLGGEGAVKRLIAEGVTTRDVRHNNVVAVYDVGEAEGSPFVSMEYIEAIPLRDWHRKQVQERRDVPLPVAARIIIEVLAGLEAAHAKGVIHRDLKPENILLTSDPTADSAPLKIVDFGIARAAGAAAIESATGTGLGTPRYMAPEQITNADSARESADLYSISIIFYELLVDVLPQGHWQPPSGGRSDIPPAIDKLIERGLSNRAASRPQSAADYRRELEQTLGRHVSPPAGPAVTGTSGGAANKKLWIGIGGGAALLVAALALSMGGEAPDSGGGGQSGVAALSGTWIDGEAQATYQVQVNPDGSFSGSGNVAGEPAQIQGGFQGNTARYVVVAGGMQYPGGLQWDGQCHLNWRTDDGAGGQLHVNHPPGAPCPT